MVWKEYLQSCNIQFNFHEVSLKFSYISKYLVGLFIQHEILWYKLTKMILISCNDLPLVCPFFKSLPLSVIELYIWVQIGYDNNHLLCSIRFDKKMCSSSRMGKNKLTASSDTTITWFCLKKTFFWFIAFSWS